MFWTTHLFPFKCPLLGSILRIRHNNESILENEHVIWERRSLTESIQQLYQIFKRVFVLAAVSEIVNGFIYLGTYAPTIALISFSYIFVVGIARLSSQ